MASNLELLPHPVSFEGRTIGEVNGRLEEGTSEVIVNDRDQATYPSIFVDPGKIIRSIGVHLVPSDVFLDKTSPGMKTVRTFFMAVHTLFTSGFLSALQLLHKDISKDSEVVTEVNDAHADDGRVMTVVRKIIPFVKSSLWFFYNQLISLYTSVYPYALLTADEQNRLFSSSLGWDQEIVKVFKWHPTASKCAVCLINDDILIYSKKSLASNSHVVPLLRHPQQKKVTDMIWKPTSSPSTPVSGHHDVILAVGCQSSIIVWNLSSFDFKGDRNRVPFSSARVIDRQSLDGCLIPPISSLTYDPTGKTLMFSTPSSSKIIIVNKLIEDNAQFPHLQQHFKEPASPSSDTQTKDETIKIINNKHRFSHGIIRLLWSPDKNRLLACPASSYIRVFEKTSWKHRDWNLPTNNRSGGMTFCQSSVWSKPEGKYLLVSVSGDSCLYALAFYDTAFAGNVGGEKEFVKVLDLSEFELPNGKTAGGVIQSMAWDQNSERLVISFKDNAEYLAVFKTSAKSMLVFEPLGFIHGETGEKAVAFDFDASFTKGSLLSIVWSTGYVSHIPFSYDPTVKKSRQQQQPLQTTSTPTARSLTSMCVSPLIKSPAASPIFSSNITQRGTGRVVPDFTFSSPSPQHVNSGSLLLMSDSVMTPRKPVLFSCRPQDNTTAG